MDTKEFDEIRPYHDEELPQAFEELTSDPEFREMARMVFPEFSFEKLEQIIKSSKTKSEFQKNLCYVVISKIIKRYTNGVTWDCWS